MLNQHRCTPLNVEFVCVCVREKICTCMCASLCMSSVNESEEYGLMFKGVQFYYFHPTTSKTAMADNVLVNRSPQAVILNAHRNPL